MLVAADREHHGAEEATVRAWREAPVKPPFWWKGTAKHSRKAAISSQM